MRARRFLLILALVTALVPGPVVRADLNYRVEIAGTEDSDLADLLEKVSELKTLEDRPPASEEALRRRADRDLGRLADAARSLGHRDAEFANGIDQDFIANAEIANETPVPITAVGCSRARAVFQFLCRPESFEGFGDRVPTRHQNAC